MVKDLKKEVEILKQKDDNTKIVTTNTNSNNTNSNNNTIVINNFGREDLTYLSKPFLENCLYHMSRGIGCLTKEIYMNDKKPENKTIKATNIKSPYVKVMKDQKMIYKDKEEALEETAEVVEGYAEADHGMGEEPGQEPVDEAKMEEELNEMKRITKKLLG
jgi:hypothetical protein